MVHEKTKKLTGLYTSLVFNFHLMSVKSPVKYVLKVKIRPVGRQIPGLDLDRSILCLHL